jgi:hypothetical protein
VAVETPEQTAQARRRLRKATLLFLGSVVTIVIVAFSVVLIDGLSSHCQVIHGRTICLR